MEQVLARGESVRGSELSDKVAVSIQGGGVPFEPNLLELDDPEERYPKPRHSMKTELGRPSDMAPRGSVGTRYSIATRGGANPFM